MNTKQYVVRKVSFGSRHHRSSILIQFETLSSFLARGGKIKSVKRIRRGGY